MRLPRAQAAIESGMARRIHVGAQLYVSRGGEVIADLAFGEARQGVAMSTDTLMLWLSSGKPVTAVAIAQQWELGRLDLDDPVARHIPEFAQRGKDAVTIRHLLTHTGGFRGAASNFNPAPWEQIIARICGAPLEANWIPGRTAGYHTASSWYVLAEIVQRLDGRPFPRYVREAIFLPAGMGDTWMGMPPEQYDAYGDRIGIMHETSNGKLHAHLSWDTREMTARCRPGANARGPIRELGRFYEVLLGRGRTGTGRLLRPQTIEAMTARHRTGMHDLTFKHTLDMGLGFIINSRLYGPDIPYGFGPHASLRTFGHGGSQSSGGFADPEHGLAVAYVFNGTPGEPAHQQRLRELTAAIYEDVGGNP